MAMAMALEIYSIWRDSTMRGKMLTKGELFVTILILAVIFIAWFLLNSVSSRTDILRYHANLESLYKALRQYSEHYDGRYPTSTQWCDLLVEHTGVDDEKFFCHWAGEPFFYDTNDPNDKPVFPVKAIMFNQYTDREGITHYSYRLRWSHFAINNNVKPNSLGTVVLLFSTKGGWNQSGGKEILSTTNEVKRRGKEGATVLLNDGTIKFVGLKELSKLNWGESK